MQACSAVDGGIDIAIVVSEVAAAVELFNDRLAAAAFTVDGDI